MSTHAKSNDHRNRQVDNDGPSMGRGGRGGRGRGRGRGNHDAAGPRPDANAAPPNDSGMPTAKGQLADHNEPNGNDNVSGYPNQPPDGYQGQREACVPKLDGDGSIYRSQGSNTVPHGGYIDSNDTSQHNNAGYSNAKKRGGGYSNVNAKRGGYYHKADERGGGYSQANPERGGYYNKAGERGGGYSHAKNQKDDSFHEDPHIWRAPGKNDTPENLRAGTKDDPWNFWLRDHPDGTQPRKGAREAGIRGNPREWLGGWTDEGKRGVRW